MSELLVRPGAGQQRIVRAAGVTPVVIGTAGGPKGDPGPAGPSPGVVLTVSAAASTWTLSVPVGFGRVPSVSVFLADNQQIIADVQADANVVVVTHASPRAGFVVLT